VVVLVVLIPCSVLIVGLPVMFMSEHQHAEQEFLDRLRSEAEVLALALADSCERGCLHEVDLPVNTLLRNEPGLLSVEVYDRSMGVRLAHWGEEPEEAEHHPLAASGGSVHLAEEGHAEEALHGSGHVFVAETPLKTKRWSGIDAPVLRIRGTSRAANERVIRMLLLALIPGGVAGIGGLLFAFWLNRRLRGVVSSLLAATAQIARGEFDERVEVHTGDELQDLGEAINGMAEALGEQRTRLDRNAETLEARLADRSLELQKARAIAVNQERVAAMGVLAAGVAHEIGNPLTAVSTIVQGMRTKAVGNPEKLEVLAENLERIREIVRSLVDHARPPGSDWELVSLNALLRRTLALVRMDPRAKAVEFEEDLDPELPRVRSVEGKLQQIVLNLLLNALDALPEGIGRVRIASGQDELEVWVAISDSGPGVPVGLREQIFTAFFSTRVEAGGTGLGLAISASLAEELGGSLSVGEGKLGGARFELRVPLEQGAS